MFPRSDLQRKENTKNEGNHMEQKASGRDCTMVLFNLRMPRWELEELRKAAREDKRSLTSFVRKAVSDEIRRKC